jgi:hypothetical protein
VDAIVGAVMSNIIAIAVGALLAVLVKQMGI